VHNSLEVVNRKRSLSAHFFLDDAGHIPHSLAMSTLHDWMRRNGVRDAAVAKIVGRDRTIVNKIRRGELLPTLTIAIAIERMTGGEVPANSWVKDDAA
jgi:DNA-binding XRE family transcriptional regulator